MKKFPCLPLDKKSALQSLFLHFSEFLCDFRQFFRESTSPAIMSTTYSATTKDKDATETYVRGSESTSTDNTKTATGKNKTTTDTDKSHDQTGLNTLNNQQYGTASSQYQQQSRGQQYGQDSHDQHGRGFQSQADVQQKLKEVGSLLQKAGHLLQDLQGSSGDFQPSAWTRGQGGNYGGPYGGFESLQSGQYGMPGQHGGQNTCHWGTGSSRFETERPLGQRSSWMDIDREDRFPSRGYSGRSEDRFESRQDRGNVDRYGGFGGPNRPDMAYGQYGGAHGSFGQEGRRGGDFESRRW